MKKSTIRLCTSFLPKTATAPSTVIGNCKVSLKSVLLYGILYIWQCSVLTIFASKIVAASLQKLADPPRSIHCHSHNENGKSTRSDRYDLLLPKPDIRPGILDLLHNVCDIRPAFRTIPRTVDSPLTDSPCSDQSLYSVRHSVTDSLLYGRNTFQSPECGRSEYRPTDDESYLNTNARTKFSL